MMASLGRAALATGQLGVAPSECRPRWGGERTMRVHLEGVGTLARYLPDSDKVLRSTLSLTSKGLSYRANGPLAARIGFKWRIIADECAAESASALGVLQGREQSQNFLSGAFEHSIVWGFKPGFVLLRMALTGV